MQLYPIANFVRLQQEPELIKKNPELLTSSFNPSDWTAVKGELR
jgi:hypothetical protein